MKRTNNSKNNFETMTTHNNKQHPTPSRNILITGGAGFIGSHLVRLFVNKYSDYQIINLDKLTALYILPLKAT